MPITRTASVFVLVSALSFSASAQQNPPPPGAPLPPPPSGPPPSMNMAPPPVYPAAELERVVSPIALYPDPLLAQVLAAATYWADIPDAARWADQHHYMVDAQLTAAMQADHLPWDPAVQALLPFPSVLSMMASSMPWTQELGAAFLAQEGDVMDAVQRQRQRAHEYGYLQSTPRYTVSSGPYISIVPVNPAYIVVPYYNPAVVYAPPPRGFYVAGAIGFGFGVRIGPAFAPWGWGATHVVWNQRVVVVNNAPWQRTWANRTTYVHTYAVPRYAVAARPAEPHRAVERTQREREAERTSHAAREEHKKAEEKKRPQGEQR